jgi:23S rRNA G2069 N7-methylase RlmK/C1962 C5-methylase RlmI
MVTSSIGRPFQAPREKIRPDHSDPPTFSRDRRSRVFRVQDDFGALADLAAACLNRNGLLLCSTNFRGMTFDEFRRILRTGLNRPFKTIAGSMPPDFTGDQYLKTLWLLF